MNTERGKNVDELGDELVVELGEPETDRTIEVPEDETTDTAPDRPSADGSDDETSKEDIRLNREQTLQDLRELQELTVDRALGRTSDPDN